MVGNLFHHHHHGSVFIDQLTGFAVIVTIIDVTSMDVTSMDVTLGVGLQLVIVAPRSTRRTRQMVVR